jgi:hypothetical protein|tara:strand:+ start:1659 stop:1850 length:192 start_codon:yes stop_codon:yes gene_type:complete
MEKYISIFSFHNSLLEIEKNKNKDLSNKIILLNEKEKKLNEIIKKQEKLIMELMKYKLLIMKK